MPSYLCHFTTSFLLSFDIVVQDLPPLLLQVQDFFRMIRLLPQLCWENDQGVHKMPLLQACKVQNWREDPKNLILPSWSWTKDLVWTQEDIPPLLLKWCLNQLVWCTYTMWILACIFSREMFFYKPNQYIHNWLIFQLPFLEYYMYFHCDFT